MRGGELSPELEARLSEANKRAIELAPQIANVSKKYSAFNSKKLTERDVSKAFDNIETFWEELFPMERHRLLTLLVERVTINEDEIDIELKTDGVSTIVADLAGLTCEAKGRKNEK
jgi:site-specific DNA recombinase